MGHHAGFVVIKDPQRSVYARVRINKTNILQVKFENNLDEDYAPLGVCKDFADGYQTFGDVLEVVLEHHKDHTWNLVDNCQVLASQILAWATQAVDTEGEPTTPWREHQKRAQEPALSSFGPAEAKYQLDT